MAQKDRVFQILDLIRAKQKVSVSELSAKFGVTGETIRRDLERLEEEGHVVKSYGGAVLNEASVMELPHNVRRSVNTVAKQKIAELVNREIDEGDHIFLDASTTSVYIARAIKQKEHLTVITNSIENLLELSLVTGAYHADKVFLSCKGLSMERGITDGNDETAGIKQAMIASAEKVYLAADHSKFDKKAFSQICGFNRIDTVITDCEPDPVWREYFAGQDIGLIYPESGAKTQ